jgi:tetratricopeptide (TPR) repeat protein
MPENPRVAYLLAYLRESQERFPEAADLLKKAVALDPDYLNAWSKLQDIASQTALPRATRQAAALAILRLDPTGRRSRPETRELGDLRSLWLAIREAEAALPPRDEGTVFPLSASARRLAAMPGDERDELRQMQGSWREDPRLRLRALLREHQTVNASAQLVEQVLRR